MAKALNYRQCVLRKKSKDGSTLEQVSWIPESLARIGKVLRLRDDGETWSNGWEVTVAGSLRPANLVEAGSRDYLRTRKASDI